PPGHDPGGYPPRFDRRGAPDPRRRDRRLQPTPADDRRRGSRLRRAHLVAVGPTDHQGMIGLIRDGGTSSASPLARLPSLTGSVLPVRRRRCERMVAALVNEASWSIPLGTPVYDVAGQRMGSVKGADNYDLSVEEGLLLVTTYKIPMALVDRYEDGAIHLSVTKAEASGNRSNLK